MRLGREQLETGAIVRPDGAHVLPVALELVGHHAHPRLEHGAQHVEHQVDRMAAQPLPQYLGLEQVDADRGKRGGGALGFLDQRPHPPVGPEGHHTEAPALLGGHGRHGQRDGGPPLDMGLEQRAIVHAVDLVAGKHEDPSRAAIHDRVPVLGNRVGCAPVPAGAGARQIGLQDQHPAALAVQIPGAARADVVVQGDGRVLGDDPDVLGPRGC